MNFYLYIIASTIFYLISDYFAKIWVTSDKWGWFPLILTLALLGSTFFYLALKKVNSISLTILFSTLAILIGGTLLGHFCFNERLNAFQYIGLGLTIVAVIFITFPFPILQK